MRLYKKYFSIHLKGAMQYKVSFFLTMIAQFFVSFEVFLGVYFMFQRFHTVEGFTYNQVLLCYSVVLFQFYLAEFFFRGFDRFSTMLGNGEFDRILVRPRNAVFQVLVSRMDFVRIGRLLQGLVLLPYAMATAGVEWDFPKLLTLLFMIVGGTLFFAGVFVIGASLSFFTTQGLEVINVFTDGIKEHGKYPLNIYGKGVLRFCTFVVPYSLVQYYPLLYLLGRETSLFYMILPLLSVWFLLPCYLVWRVGLRHYKSTGS